MKRYIIAALVFLCSFTLKAINEEQENYQKANGWYQKGDYKKAVIEYEKIIQNGYESPELYYNLGNSYYKLFDYKSAILNYERAKRLAPNDEDILFNLRLANLNTVDKIEPLPPFFLKNWWMDVVHLHNATDWAIISIVAFALTSLFGIFFLLTNAQIGKKICFSAAVLFLCFSILSFSFARTMDMLQYHTKEAILFVSNSYIKSSPSDKSTDLFLLHEGTKMSVLDNVGSWTKIRLVNGDEGWIKSNEIRII
ncbi:MAG TPA: tetratricopeptide repeat protein [Cytophagaceae bacterium]|jgi:tetratricopeptide (TPR) repeat protein|nr:tetratricopeptide repeat protein [Cytophagaceae bacterium]